MIHQKLILIALITIAPVFADKNADNTGLNQRDADMATLTPIDQSKGSKQDVEFTRQIRQRIVKEKSLSHDADNIKIITLNGIATLRGPVQSAAERTKIAAIAAQVVGGDRAVRNELEIKTE